MKSLLSFLVLLLAAVAQALSVGGRRILAIWDDQADQSNYSKFVRDLEGKEASCVHSWP